MVEINARKGNRVKKWKAKKKEDEIKEETSVERRKRQEILTKRNATRALYFNGRAQCVFLDVPAKSGTSYDTHTHTQLERTNQRTRDPETRKRKERKGVVQSIIRVTHLSRLFSIRQEARSRHRCRRRRRQVDVANAKLKERKKNMNRSESLTFHLF